MGDPLSTDAPPIHPRPTPGGPIQRHGACARPGTHVRSLLLTRQSRNQTCAHLAINFTRKVLTRQSRNQTCAHLAINFTRKVLMEGRWGEATLYPDVKRRA